MADQSNQPKPLSAETEQPQVYSVRQDKDGRLHFSRRDFLYLTGAIGGMLLLKGVCPRFDLNASAAGPPQAGNLPADKVYIHAAAGIDSNIVDILAPGDRVRLIRDHPDQGWVEVATRTGQRGWVDRSLVDFSHAIQRASPDFDAIDAPPPTPTQPLASEPTQAGASLSMRDGGISTRKDLPPARAQYYVDVIRNGDFEAGHTEWVEVAPGTIIRNDWPDPYQGDWVAWLGGNDAHETLTQLFHVPADVHPDQTLEYMLKVTTDEVGSTVFDRLYLRFLDGVGNPLVSDLLIADNTTPMDWTKRLVYFNGMTDVADQMMQIQFKDDTDSSNVTSFVIDQVSFNLLCGPVTPTPTLTATKTATPTATPTPVYYTFLPVMVKPTAPTSTPTPTRTPTLTPTPCSAHCGCDSGYCGSDCGCDSTYCSSDCRSDCGYVCVYDCPFECIYDCGFN